MLLLLFAAVVVVIIIIKRRCYDHEFVIAASIGYDHGCVLLVGVIIAMIGVDDFRCHGF